MWCPRRASTEGPQSATAAARSRCEPSTTLIGRRTACRRTACRRTVCRRTPSDPSGIRRGPAARRADAPPGRRPGCRRPWAPVPNRRPPRAGLPGRVLPGRASPGGSTLDGRDPRRTPVPRIPGPVARNGTVTLRKCGGPPPGSSFGNRVGTRCKSTGCGPARLPLAISDRFCALTGCDSGHADWA